MRRVVLAWVAVLLAFGPAEAARKSSPEAALRRIQKEVGAVAAGLETGQCDAARARKLSEDPDLLQAPPLLRSLVWTLHGFCDGDAIEEAARRATAEPETLAMAWSLRFAAAVGRDDMADALPALAAAVERKADGSLVLIDDLVFAGARELSEDETRFAEYAALLDRADWRPDSPHYGGDWLWARYAGILAARGDRTHAWRLASRIEEPADLLVMTLDKRYDAIVAIDPARFDLVAAAERRLTRGRALTSANSRDGSAVSLSVSMLRLLGRQDEALSLLDTTLAQTGDVLDADGDDHRNWLLNDRALVLLELGRFDDAVAAMEAAASRPEGGAPRNVSQTINLAGLQNATGRFEAALATLAVFEAEPKDVSPYGVMWINAERACAYAGLERSKEAAAVVAHTAANAAENANARTKALLCVNDLDGVAESFRTRLADPMDRADALVALSSFKAPAHRTPFEAQLGRRMDEVRARADVRAAVEPVGRTSDLPIQAGPLIDTY
ncbi:MAG: hypothetical protein ACOY5Y_15510 [Pseudomonadota bacterium]